MIEQYNISGFREKKINSRLVEELRENNCETPYIILICRNAYYRYATFDINMHLL